MIDNDWQVDDIEMYFKDDGIKFEFKDNFNKGFSKKDISC